MEVRSLRHSGLWGGRARIRRACPRALSHACLGAARPGHELGGLRTEKWALQARVKVRQGRSPLRLCGRHLPLPGSSCCRCPWRALALSPTAPVPTSPLAASCFCLSVFLTFGALHHLAAGPPRGFSVPRVLADKVSTGRRCHRAGALKSPHPPLQGLCGEVPATGSTV